MDRFSRQVTWPRRSRKALVRQVQGCQSWGLCVTKIREAWIIWTYLVVSACFLIENIARWGQALVKGMRKLGLMRLYIDSVGRRQLCTSIALLILMTELLNWLKLGPESFLLETKESSFRYNGWREVLSFPRLLPLLILVPLEVSHLKSSPFKM